MSILIVLIPCSLALGMLALAAFIWTLKSGQYDDIEGDSYRAMDEPTDARNQPGLQKP